ncbi:MAG: hypothetical protein IT304_05580 [Dehalococcoidia bacterium]|nr:hypothetical protein [Dehalococcoidia bacterium]
MAELAVLRGEIETFAKRGLENGGSRAVGLACDAAAPLPLVVLAFVAKSLANSMDGPVQVEDLAAAKAKLLPAMMALIDRIADEPTSSAASESDQLVSAWAWYQRSRRDATL